ncbi:uncharacterized mitochondrial protein AtMg00810-like [Vicia villosa]|uniref:uncharacterized mitochondrial protein AtMg00810-like n=1 Tax=Vicia villosa TaxID=3911 RepID=UPI00273C4228|nr:uncharacterized mitochondrial protein AtMg00810-like [Vicia villosa]
MNLDKKFSKLIQGEFEMSMMGEPNYFLGLQIKQLKEGNFVSQTKYCQELIKRFDMAKSKIIDTPMPTAVNLDQDEHGYSDSDFSGCKLDRKSTSGTCHFFSNSLVSWHSKKQVFVALSTAEAEYVAAGNCCAQILWLKQQLLDYNVRLDHIPIFCNNTSAIILTKNPILHSCTKHIEIRHHFLRDHVEKGDVVFEHVESKN